MMNRILISLACLALASAAPSFAVTGLPTPAIGRMKDSIMLIIRDEEVAWSKGDAEAFAQHVTSNISFTNAVGMFSVGKKPFLAQHQHIFATIYNGSVMRQYKQNIAIVGKDVVIVDTITKVSGFKGLPAGISAVSGALYTRLEQVMVLKNGKWMVAAFHNVPIQPSLVAEAVKSLPISQSH